MKVLVTGATGAVGPAVVNQLVESGHAPVVVARNEHKARSVLGRGIRVVSADLLDAAQVDALVEASEPDAIVHQATALNSQVPITRFRELFRETNKLRTLGTDHLVAAASKYGVPKIVAQAFCGWPYAKFGGPVIDETHPFDTALSPQLRETSEALQHLEAAVTGGATEGVALRYGGFYGPRTSFDTAGSVVEQLRRRSFPMIGAGTGWWSFIHVADAAMATVSALKPGVRGIFNIVDDDPAPVREWLPYLCSLLRAPSPLGIPSWLGRLVAGDHVVSMMNDLRAGSNKKAKAALSWSLRYPSWRAGFADTFQPASRAAE
jgi:nucleoside-diphosphate-sugar epimerase